MKKKEEVKKILVMAILAGKIMLKSGAETYRVEDTITRICKSRAIKFAEAFVTPTGIFLSVEYEDEIMTYIKRIKKIVIDLNKVSLVNEFSRKFVATTMSVDEAMTELTKVDATNKYRQIIRILSGGVAGSFFTLMFDGTPIDSIAAFLISSIVVILLEGLGKLNITFFLSHIVGSMLATILAILVTLTKMNFNMDKIIIGSIMVLVPGVAITNAIRDSISGDFISGMSRGLEAIIIALSIAFGVGVTLRLYFSILGGI